jgi:RNA polymerase sigma factor (sigma-70 family)
MSRLGYRRVAARLRRADATADPPTDADLLARFAAAHDEAAFAELVARHGPLVRGTARRRLADAHAAEDVYQAAFLVLARKAGSLRWRETVGPWLYAAAVRLARKAVRRSAPAQGVPPDLPTSHADPTATAARAEELRALDDELSALPARLRDPLVLCYLQGRTRDEAAAALGWTLAMLKRRLERGRKVLRDRLTRRGVAPPVAGAGVLLAEVMAGGPAAAATARAAVEFVVSGKASPGVATLVGGSGWLLRAAATVVVAGLVACGAAAVPDRPAPGPTADPPAPAEAAAGAPGDPLPAGTIARLGTVRLRPGGSVELLAFSPDGTRIASWSTDSHINDALVIWDTKTGRPLRRVDLPGARVGALVWLADGRGLALYRTAYDDPAPRVWEFTDEATTPPVKPRAGGGGGVGKAVIPNGPPEDNEHDSCYAINPDGKTIAVGRAGQLQRDREVRLYRLPPGGRLDALPKPDGAVTHPDNCGQLYFSPDGNTLVVFTPAKFLGGNKFEDEQVVTAWDLRSGKQKSRFAAPRPANQGERAAVALADALLAIGLQNGDTSLWDLDTGKERTLATGHVAKAQWGGRGTHALAFLPGGKSLLTSGRDGAGKLWDVASGRRLQVFERHATWVEAAAASRDGKTLATAGQDGVIRLWDAATGADACPQTGHTYMVGHVALSRDGRTAVTAGWDNTLRWWDATTGAELRSVPAPEGLAGMARSPDGGTLLGATDGEGLRAWDAATGRPTTPAGLPGGAKFRVLSFTPDGRHLVAASGPQVSVLAWPAMTHVRTIDLPKPANEPGENSCLDAAVSADGRWLVTVAERSWFREEDGLRYGYAADGVVDVWEFATGKRVRRLAEAQTTFRSGAFTADGRYVLIGSPGKIPGSGDQPAEEFTGEMNLLDPVAGRWVRRFEVPTRAASVTHRYVGASALAPDGRTLYVSYNTGEIIGYEVATGKPRRTLTGHRGYVGALAFGADGRRLISGGRDSTALVWDATLVGASRSKPSGDVVKAWETAATGEPAAAFAAMAALALAPDRTVEILRGQLKPVSAAPTAADVDRIFAAFDSPDFTTREKAARELAGYGESAVPAVRAAVAKAESAEVRRRAGAFLAQFDRAAASPERVREVRAVELLEGIGTPGARAFLKELAGGAASAPLTLEAAAALRRLGGG